MFICAQLSYLDITGVVITHNPIHFLLNSGTFSSQCVSCTLHVSVLKKIWFSYTLLTLTRGRGGADGAVTVYVIYLAMWIHEFGGGAYEAVLKGACIWLTVEFKYQRSSSRIADCTFNLSDFWFSDTPEELWKGKSSDKTPGEKYRMQSITAHRDVHCEVTVQPLRASHSEWWRYQVSQSHVLYVKVLFFSTVLFVLDCDWSRSRHLSLHLLTYLRVDRCVCVGGII